MHAASGRIRRSDVSASLISGSFDSAEKGTRARLHSRRLSRRAALIARWLIAGVSQLDTRDMYGYFIGGNYMTEERDD